MSPKVSSGQRNRRAGRASGSSPRYSNAAPYCPSRLKGYEGIGREIVKKFSAFPSPNASYSGGQLFANDVDQFGLAEGLVQQGVRAEALRHTQKVLIEPIVGPVAAPKAVNPLNIPLLHDPAATLSALVFGTICDRPLLCYRK